MSERWCAIPDFPAYEVSDGGRVRSWHRRDPHTGSPRLLRTPPGSTGYPHVSLYHTGAHRGRYAAVHLLVLGAFVGPRPGGCVAQHRNGDRIDNRLANLAWVSRQAAARRGASSPRSRLTDDRVVWMRQHARAGTSLAELAQRLGVSAHTVWLAVHGRTWAHVNVRAAPIVERGGVPRGECSPLARLTAAEVVAMRERAAAGATLAMLAAAHGVSLSAVSLIIRGQRWTQVGGPITHNRRLRV
jgi:hypothetical protein